MSARSCSRPDSSFIRTRNGRLAYGCPFASRTASREVMAGAQGLLAEHGCDLAELDLIAVSTGPGLFTGVRVGLSIGKALAWGQGAGAGRTALVAVPTLEAVASLAASLPELRYVNFQDCTRLTDAAVASLAGTARSTPTTPCRRWIVFSTPSHPISRTRSGPSSGRFSRASCR